MKKSHRKELTELEKLEAELNAIEANLGFELKISIILN